MFLIDLKVKFCFCRFFRVHPYFQPMFGQLKELRGEQEMRQSRQFEAQSLAVLSLFDFVIENLDKDVDAIHVRLEEVAKIHARIEGFHADLFQVFYIHGRNVPTSVSKVWLVVSASVIIVRE